MRNFCSLTVLLILFFSCNTSKNGVYKQTDSQIFFGNSGGFTNVKLEYVLNDDGNIFKIEKDSVSFVKKIDHSQFKKIQNSIDECEFRNIQLNSPGNLSYFIRVKTKEFENEVVWSDMTTNGPVEIIYNKLFDSLKK
jgi:hypothetical protein